MQLPQRPQLVTAHLVRRRLAVLEALDVHRRGPQVDIIPAEFADLGSPQTVPIGYQDHGRVPMTVAIGLGRLDQLLDLGLGQVLPLAIGGVGSASDCSLFDRSGRLGARCDFASIVGSLD